MIHPKASTAAAFSASRLAAASARSTQGFIRLRVDPLSYYFSASNLLNLFFTMETMMESGYFSRKIR